MKHWLLLSCLSLTLAACKTVGPNYDGPKSDVANAPSAQGEFVSRQKGPFVDAPVPGQWWRLYADPRLDALVEQALAANTDLRVALANIEVTQARLREVQNFRNVQTSIGSGVALARPSGTGQSFPGTFGYDIAISASYEIDVVGRLRRLIEAANADNEAAQAAYDLARMTVVANVVRAYADACNAGYQRKAAVRSLSLQEQSLATTERLIRAGRGTALDRSRGQALVDQLRSTIPGFDATRENALFRLATLTGRPPAEFPIELAACAETPRVMTPLPVGDGAALIRRRPDIRQAERVVAASSARIGVAMAELYPQVRLGGSLGFAGPFSTFDTGDSFGMSLGPLISWSFPNRTAARAHIAESEATERAALARFDGTVLEALREAESALTSYAHDIEANAALRAARDQARVAAGQAQRLYRAGRESFLTVLDAQRTLAVSEAQLAASDARLSADQVAVFLALGGGWEKTPAE